MGKRRQSCSASPVSTKATALLPPTIPPWSTELDHNDLSLRKQSFHSWCFLLVEVELRRHGVGKTLHQDSQFWATSSTAADDALVSRIPGIKTNTLFWQDFQNA